MNTHFYVIVCACWVCLRTLLHHIDRKWLYQSRTVEQDHPCHTHIHKHTQNKDVPFNLPHIQENLSYRTDSVPMMGKWWYSNNILLGWWKLKAGKKKNKKQKDKVIAPKMSSVISFLSASHFKEDMKNLPQWDFKGSWDVLKLILQARQTKLESHCHHDSNGLCHLTIKYQNWH